MGAIAVGRQPVTGIIPFEEWADALGEKKKTIIEKLRAKKEANEQARAARKEEIAQKREEKIDKKVRAKILKETFAALGKDENFVQNQHDWINEQRGSDSPIQEGSVSGLDRSILIAKGAFGSAKADEREKRNKVIESGKDLAKLFLPALALKMSAFLSQSFLAPVILPATAGVIIVKLAQTLKRKDKSIASNLADANEKLDACEAALNEFETKLKVVETALLNAKDKLAKDYKTMNKKEFNALLLKTIVSTLCAAGLLTAEEALNKTGLEDIKDLMGFSQLPFEAESSSKEESVVSEEVNEEESEEDIEIKEESEEKELKKQTEEDVKTEEMVAKEAEEQAAKEQAEKEAKELEESTELGGE